MYLVLNGLEVLLICERTGGLLLQGIYETDRVDLYCLLILARDGNFLL